MSLCGIQDIAAYIPITREDNRERLREFQIDESFLTSRLGVLSRSKMGAQESVVSMCEQAFEALQNKTKIDASEIGAVTVVTQNPDFLIPHMSSVLHGVLGLSASCACFDINLGCSGYVYGLSILESFLKANGMPMGLLFTADPYSRIVDPSDKNTALLFGDAATVTLLSRNPVYCTGRYSFGTDGKHWEELSVAHGKLFMNGRAVYDFAATRVPADIQHTLQMNGLSLPDIDVFVLHQGSKHMLDTIGRRLNIEHSKLIIDMLEYGNTVSSSIPIILEKILFSPVTNASQALPKTIVISGFGVGLSWATGILRRARENEA